MPDLYETLGVGRDADRPTVRRAYRQKAKRAHPDHGGTAEQFALVKIAHDTLTDDAARAHYDQTGEFGAKAVDNRHAEAMNILASALDKAMAALYDRGVPPKESDMVAAMQRWIEGEREKTAQPKREFEKNRGRTAELVGRFEQKTDAELNVMELILRERLRIIDAEIAKGAALLAKLDFALELLRGFRFKAETRIVSDQELRRRAAENAYNGQNGFMAAFAGGFR